MSYLKNILTKIYYKPFLFFILITLVTFWAVSGFLYSMQYDAIDVMLPWRNLASESLSNGIFPYWNPYQQCGYPFYTDMQYPIWYHEVFFTSLSFGYSNYTLHFLYLFYVAMAGMGMYKLSKEFKVDHHFSLLAGIVFMLSGIFIGHAQSIISILGATWLPWALAYYLRMINNHFKWSNVLKFSLFAFLMLTGGYQAVSFMLFYLFVALFFGKITSELIKKNYSALKSILGMHLLSALMLLILLAGVILSVYHTLPYVERMGGLSLETSQGYIFHPKSTLSFLMPYAAIKLPTPKTDISIINNFIGAGILLFSFFAFFKKLPLQLYILIGYGFLCLLASFGQYTPIQPLFYKYLPFLDMFRFPSFYRYFYTVSAILASIYYLNNIYKEKVVKPDLKLLVVVSALALFYLSFCIGLFKDFNFHDNTFLQSNLNFIQKFRKSGLNESIFLQSILGFAIYISLLLTIFLKKYPIRKVLFVFVLIEMTFTAQLNIPVTVCVDFKPSDIHESLNRQPKGFPVPDNVPISQNTDNQFSEYNLWRNLGNFSKQPTWGGYSSFALDEQVNLADNFKPLQDSVLQNKLVYLSSDLRPFKEYNEKTINYNSKTIFLEDSLYMKFFSRKYSNSPNDYVAITSFKPNKIECDVNTTTVQWLILLQGSFSGWEITIDDEVKDLYSVNKLFMAVEIPAESHKVVFSFKRKSVLVLYIISIVGFLVLLSLIAFLKFPKHRKVVFSGISLLVIGLLISFITNRTKARNRISLNQFVYEKTVAITKKSAEKNLILNSWDRSDSIQSTGKHVMEIQRSTPKLISMLGNQIEEENYKEIHYSRINNPVDPQILSTIHSFLPCSKKITKWSANSGISTFYNCEQNRYPLADSIYWSLPGIEDSVTYHSVPSSSFIDSSQEYSSAFTLKSSEIPKGKNRIIYFSGFLKWKEAATSYLVIDIYRKNYENIYKAIDLAEYKNSAEWNFFSFATYIPDKLMHNSIIKIYIWNPEKAAFYLDNVKADYIIDEQKTNEP